MTPDQRTTREKFEALNRFVTERQAWIVSPPGNEVIRLECLPGSPLPDDLARVGYEVTPAGEGQRVLPGCIVERFAMASNGEFEPISEGSTKAVARTVRHAGIVIVERYDAVAGSGETLRTSLTGT